MTEFCKKDKVIGDLKNPLNNIDTALNLREEFKKGKIKISYANKKPIENSDKAKKFFEAYLRGYMGEENYSDIAEQPEEKKEK
jgi:hypothetical protein